MPILDMFTLKPDGTLQKQHCKLCTKAYKWRKGGGTGTLSQHLAAKHPIAFAAHEKKAAAAAASAMMDDEVTSIASSKKRSAPAAAASVASSDSLDSSSQAIKKQKQLTIAMAFSPSTDASLARQAAIAFASNRIPFNVARNAEFRAFLDSMRKASVAAPSDHAIKQATLTAENEMRERVLQRLRSSSLPVAIVIDGWTNVRQSKVTNIVLLCDSVAYYWCSISNASEKNTAAWMNTAIEPCIAALVEEGLRITAFVADNESVNQKLFKLLEAKYPFLIRVPCAAHTIQLVVKNSMKSDRWARVRASVDELLKLFASSKEMRQRLLNKQQDEKTTYQLVKPNDTRWNSFLFACERLLKLEDIVKMVLKHYQLERPADFWTDMAALVAFLQPFQIATDIIQKDSATLYDIFLQWSMLSEHVKKMPAGDEQREAMKALRDRWSKQVNNDATIAAAILSLDVKLSAIDQSFIEDARTFIVDFGVVYLDFFKQSSLPAEKLKGALLVQLGQLSLRRERFARLDENIHATKLSEGKSWKALSVWSLYEMELAVVARALLTVPASEAAVERTFSAQGSIHTKIRSRLDDSTVQASMFIAFNHRTLNAPASTSSSMDEDESTITLSLDFMDTDSESESEPEEELPVVREESKSDDDDEVKEEEEVEAAVIQRTNSEINADTRSFLESYIKKNGITLKDRWTGDKVVQLEKAALEENPGGANTRTLIEQMKAIMHCAAL
jgi:hypothetical protein